MVVRPLFIAKRILTLFQRKKLKNGWLIINNIKKYINFHDGFVIFDEQKVVGSGAWVKAFYKITSKNRWILFGIFKFG